jgi:hypothetical protein
MRTLAPFARGFVLLTLLVVAGCGENTYSSWCKGGGVVVLSWTIRGQPPTADQGCAGVARMVTVLSSNCNQVEIEPIPCISGERWRYDGLPQGTNYVTVIALDQRQREMARGNVTVDLEPTVPADATPVDLQ